MTLDLRPKWLNVTRSLQKAACRNNGLAVVSSQIVVNESGDPVTWTEPDVTRLGPLSSQGDLIKLLTSLKSQAYREEEYLVAQILDSTRLVINKGENVGLCDKDWFIYIDNNHPYAMLYVSELRERIAILNVAWTRKVHQTVPIAAGDRLYKVLW